MFTGYVALEASLGDMPILGPVVNTKFTVDWRMGQEPRTHEEIIDAIAAEFERAGRVIATHLMDRAKNPEEELGQ